MTDPSIPVNAAARLIALRDQLTELRTYAMNLYGTEFGGLIERSKVLAIVDALLTAWPDPPQGGATLIAGERARQVQAEGWTPAHDDAHDDGQLASAAACYIAENERFYRSDSPPTRWPWEARWWKPSLDPIRNLVKAGALIAAEIDRLQRLAAPAVIAHPPQQDEGKQ